LDKRRITQIIATIISNANIKGFFSGKIYKGELKNMCTPGLNCYSCPGAIGSCPIGAIQSVANMVKYSFSFYVVGLIALIGIVFGRFACGWLCPFGLLQDLIYKVPIFKININKNIHRIFSYLKYFILAVFVIFMPMVLVNRFGIGIPYFCKYICPAGTLEGGLLLVILNDSLRSIIGGLFVWKVSVLVVIIIFSLTVYRFFCKYICPLGAAYSLFNKISIYKYELNKNKCTKCLKCVKKCKMNVEVHKNLNSLECIRCGECIKGCPSNAIKAKFTFYDFE
jgi:ferredoxin-type protein NapH